MSQKISYEFIKKKTEESNYKLLSKDYEGYYNKLKFKCDKGHIYKTSWNIFKIGSRCPKCYRQNQSIKMTKSFSEIKDYIENKGFTLLSENKDYKNQYSKLNVICPNNHKIKIYWAEFRRQKNGCSICSGVKKKTIQEVKEYVKKFSYECLSKKYINLESKLKFKCPEGHIYKTTWAIFKQGSRCPECERIKRSIKYSGSNCIFWKGGIANEPYCQNWTSEFKEIIKERDNNKCLNPECSSGKHICVHHVDYNKKNCNFNNLITVCKSCNAKANFNREWHTSWYKAILLNRYNYKY